MSGGGKGGSGSQKISTDPWKPAQPFIQQGLQGASDLYKNGPGFYTPQNTLQNQGQGMALDYANGFGGMYKPFMDAGSQALSGGPGQQYGVGGAVNGGLNTGANSNPFGAMGLNNAMQFGFNAPDIKNNPYIGQYMDAATRPLQQQLDNQTMPGIRSGYTGAGQYGSSRQGISEGLARGMTNQAIGDTRATIANNAYGQGLGAQANAMNSANQGYGLNLQNQGQALNFAGQDRGQTLDQQARGLSLYPGVMQAGLTPSSIYSQAGATNQADQNAQQTDVYKQLQNYLGSINGNWGSQQTTQGGGSSPLMGGLGGALGGFGLGSMLPGGASAGGMGPLTQGGWGAALGGLLGLFS